jgi:hypothetical protein
MPSPARLTGNLAVGLVNVPIRLYVATRTEGIACHLLHDRRGSRIQDQSYCPVSNVEVPREERVRGFASTKDGHVRITAASGDGPQVAIVLLPQATMASSRRRRSIFADEYLWLHPRVGSGGARHSSIPFGAASRKPYSACGSAAVAAPAGARLSPVRPTLTESCNPMRIGSSSICTPRA